MTALQFRMLGPLEVVRDGRAVALGGPRQRATLALLLIEANRAVPIDRLLEELWTEGPRKRVHVAITRLRRVLGAESLETVAGGYRLVVSASDLDAEVARSRIRAGREALAAGAPERAAEALRTAVALWRGPVLADLTYAPFAASVIRELGDLRLEALELAIEAELGAERHREVVGELDTLVAEHPLRERFHAQRMLALYRCGRQPEALAAYREARDRLVGEFGLEPGPELRALETQILAQRVPAARPRAPALPAVLEAELQTPLLGRDAEAAALREAWSGVVAGAQRTVLLAGEPGIGKTRLAADIAHQVVAGGHRALYAACDEALVMPGRPLAAALGLPSPAPANTADPAADRLRLLDATAGRLRAAAPALLILDDLHWADELTLLALRHVIRSERAPALLIVGTYRDGEPSALLADLIADATRRAGVSRITLGPLGREDVEALVGPERAVAVYEATDGNPFYVRELARDPQTVPAGVRDVLRARLAHLSAPAVAVLSTAALMGREFKPEILLALADADAVWAALESGEREGLVRPVAGGFAFSHAIVADALAHALPAARRARVHERLGLALADRPRPRAAEVAYHFAHAIGRVQETIRWARAAGDEALAELAFGAAADHYAAALEHTEDLRLRVAHGRALRLAGAPAAPGVLLDAARAAEAAGDGELMAAALLALNLAYASAMAPGSEYAALLRRALQSTSVAATRAQLLGALALEGQNVTVPEERERLACDALRLARVSGSPMAIARTLIARQWVAMHPAATPERLELAGTLVEVATANDLPFEACMGHAFRFAACLELGDRAGLEAALAAAARTPGQAAGKWVVAFNHAAWTLARGDLERAEQEAIAAVSVGEDANIDASILFSGVTGQLACIRMQQGRLSELEVPLMERLTAQPYLASWRSALALLRCEQGRHDEARAEFSRAMALPAVREPLHDQWSSTLVVLAEVAAALGERDAARELYVLLSPFAGRMTWNTACTFGPFDLALARLCAVTGADARPHLEAARALCDAVGAAGFAQATERQSVSSRSNQR